MVLKEQEGGGLPKKRGRVPKFTPEERIARKRQASENWRKEHPERFKESVKQAGIRRKEEARRVQEELAKETNRNPIDRIEPDYIKDEHAERHPRIPYAPGQHPLAHRVSNPRGAEVFSLLKRKRNF